MEQAGGKLPGCWELGDLCCRTGWVDILMPGFLFSPENLGRRIQIQRSGHLNLYLLLDASQSVSEKDFEIFKESATLMVDRVRVLPKPGGFPALLGIPPNPLPSRNLPRPPEPRVQRI